MPRAVTDGVTMCAGRVMPSNIGPTCKPFAQHFGEIEGAVGGVQRRHDQQVRRALQARVREDAVANGFANRRVGVHLAFHVEIRCTLMQHAHRVPHLPRRRRIGVAEIGVADQRYLRLDAQSRDLLGGEQGNFHQFGCGRIRVYVGVGEEIGAGRQHQRAQRRDGADRLLVDDIEHVAQVPGVLAVAAAQQRVGFAQLQHDGGDRRRIGSHDGARRGGRDAAPLHPSVIELGVLRISRIVLGIADGEVGAGADFEAQMLAALLDHTGTADQDRLGQPVM